jgi:hypothetical protein
LVEALDQLAHALSTFGFHLFCRPGRDLSLTTSTRSLLAATANRVCSGLAIPREQRLHSPDPRASSLPPDLVAISLWTLPIFLKFCSLASLLSLNKTFSYIAYNFQQKILQIHKLLGTLYLRGHFLVFLVPHNPTLLHVI